MATRNATVRVGDLEQALDYLEGLVLILTGFHECADGDDPRPRLLDVLQSMDSLPGGWEPLRYQTADGQGWYYVAGHVRELRERLLGGYADAAL